MSSYRDILASHLDPLLFLYTSLSYLPATLLTPRDSTSPSFRESWFLRFWTSVSPSIRAGSSPRVAALLQGRASKGAVTDDEVHPPLSGTVLEIGAGTGVWAQMLASQPSVARVYGIEPNGASVRALEKAVKKANVDGKYVIVPAGIEDAGRWVERGSLDCVVTILCMCSVPEPEAIAREVYGYLKPGGRWYVYEHVRADGAGWWVKRYQAFLNLFWPTMIGGCDLTRTTMETLQKAGIWAKVDVARCVDEPWHHAIPHIYGILTK
ncbi:uncharacterized protein DNG_10162 [Cephalotrichum gorgonifer]|uniref:S-adenosyl-L-methionine-dependent methyltransferase n=1 Tax=Cephalotrichum gorgonifer TaxID=2041049 RepID=A0AAE8T022_9PEZI|nr:uncharacterized protein DNG_10162 [Cephalotrichum gorgonifer]